MLGARALGARSARTRPQVAGQRRHCPHFSNLSFRSVPTAAYAPMNQGCRGHERRVGAGARGKRAAPAARDRRGAHRHLGPGHRPRRGHLDTRSLRPPRHPPAGAHPAGRRHRATFSIDPYKKAEAALREGDRQKDARRSRAPAQARPSSTRRSRSCRRCAPRWWTSPTTATATIAPNARSWTTSPAGTRDGWSGGDQAPLGAVNCLRNASV